MLKCFDCKKAMFVDFFTHYCLPPFVAESVPQTSERPPSSRAYNQP
jgi:hypothetical protein